VGIFSLEMSTTEITKRMISSLSEVDAHRIQSGCLTRDDWEKIYTATSDLTSAGIYIDDSANPTKILDTHFSPLSGGGEFQVIDGCPRSPRSLFCKK
jgi:replicative DNA helicase